MMGKILQFISLGGLAFLASMPASTNYQLNNYGFGSGGVGSSSSTLYSANAITGEQSGVTATGTTYASNPGHNSTQQANVPAAPSFTNPNNWYNKLKFVINTSGNPSDAKFLIAISSDNFVTTNYIHSD